MNKGIFHHETIYRGRLDKMAQTHITVCGAGALGSNLIDNLSRQGFTSLRTIDMDRVEQHNINTQVYNIGHVGALKVAALKALVFQNVGIEIEAENKQLIKNNVKKLLKNTNLVVDCFDNSESRAIVTDHCLTNNIECLHVGLFEGYGEVIWNKNYKVPKETDDVDPCEIGLARNLVLLTVVAASEEIINAINAKDKKSLFITIKDLSIRKT
jgi:molybdopterin-synthase adenylyltransferase